MIFQSPLQQFLLWQLEIVLLKMKDTGERNMIQTSGCLKGVDEATGGAAGKSPSQSNAELASLEPPPPPAQPSPTSSLPGPVKMQESVQKRFCPGLNLCKAGNIYHNNTTYCIIYCTIKVRKIQI